MLRTLRKSFFSDSKMAEKQQFSFLAIICVCFAFAIVSDAAVVQGESASGDLPFSPSLASLVGDVDLLKLEREVGYPIKYCDELPQNGEASTEPTSMPVKTQGTKLVATTEPVSGGMQFTPEPTSATTMSRPADTPSSVPLEGVKAGEDYGTCDAHPAKFPGLLPVLVKHWTYKRFDERTSLEPLPNFYLPRFQGFWYRPFEDKSSTKYKGLDLFYSHWDFEWNADPEAITMEFYRPARLYFVVGAIFVERNPGKGTLSGYKSEGWVQTSTMDQGKRPSVTYGIAEQRTTPDLPVYGYVFSKQVSGTVKLPGGGWIQKNVRGLNTPQGRYLVFIAEEDGSPSAEQKSPPGVGPIKPGTRCPQELHDKWKTGGDDPNDSDIAGKLFSTWHPMWDPCYRCGYEHEHGSNAGALMGIKPMYDYPAWKNNRQDEPHPGFKTIVYRSGRYLVAYDFHFVLGISRRFFNTHHSGTITIVDASTKDLMAKLQMKLDYGRFMVRKPNIGSMNLHPEDDAVEQKEKDSHRSQRSRLFNVMKSKNRSERDPRYGYNDNRNGKDFSMGRYEQWRTVFICMTESQKTTFRVDIRDPATAIQSATSKQSDPLVELGVTTDGGEFIRSKSLSRRLDVGNLQLSKKLCNFSNSATVPDGVFYTDPFGKEVFSTPGPNRARQYIKPGFSITFEDGDYQVDELVNGMYANLIGKDISSMTFEDMGHTINANRN